MKDRRCWYYLRRRHVTNRRPVRKLNRAREPCDLNFVESGGIGSHRIDRSDSGNSTVELRTRDNIDRARPPIRRRRRNGDQTVNGRRRNSRRANGKISSQRRRHHAKRRIRTGPAFSSPFSHITRRSRTSREERPQTPSGRWQPKRKSFGPQPERQTEPSKR